MLHLNSSFPNLSFELLKFCTYISKILPEQEKLKTLRKI